MENAYVFAILEFWRLGGWQGLDSKEFPPPPCLGKPEILPLPKSRLDRSMSWNSVVILHQKLNIEQPSRIFLRKLHRAKEFCDQKS